MSYNLLSEKWIPVLDRNGAHRYVSLTTAFSQASRIATISGSPLEKVSILRLMLCVAQASFGRLLKGNEWEEAKEDIVPNALAYLKKHSDCFDLYHPKYPFLQAAGLEKIQNRSLDNLFITKASGDNHTLRDRGAIGREESYTPAEITRALLSFQTFVPGGLIQASAKWGGKKTSGKISGKKATLNNALVTVYQGANLLTTIHLQFMTDKELGTIKLGKPVWEIQPKSQEDAKKLHTYLGILVPMTRAILLEPGSHRMSFVDGLLYPDNVVAYRDPMITERIIKKGKEEEPSALPINLSKEPWRELESLLTAKKGGPLAADRAKQLEIAVDVWCGGLACNKAKIVDEAEWVYHIPRHALSSDEVTDQNFYGSLIECSENVCKALSTAMWCFVASLKNAAPKDDKTLKGIRNRARLLFWSEMSMKVVELFKRYEKDPDTEHREWWLKECRKVAYRSYKSITGSTQKGRSIQAFVFGHNYLRKEANSVS